MRTGSFYGIVGPNGAGKTTTLSMVTGLLRPDAGTVIVHDVDVWAEPAKAKRMTGVLPDRLRLFDRLTGAQLLYYSGVLRGLDAQTVRTRSADLVSAFGLDEAHQPTRRRLLGRHDEEDRPRLRHDPLTAAAGARRAVRGRRPRSRPPT